MRPLTSLAFAAALVCPAAASAHFPYLHVSEADGRAELHAYFGHGVEPTEERFFDRLEGAAVWRLAPDEAPRPVSLRRGKESLVADVPAGPAAYAFAKDQGVVSRNGDYLLTNYAKAYSGRPAWAVDASRVLKLDVAPRVEGETLTVTVRWDGKPLAGADVVVERGESKAEGKTDAEGRFSAPFAGPGVTTVRAWRIEKTPGERDGKTYDDVRHYSTLTLDAE